MKFPSAPVPKCGLCCRALPQGISLRAHMDDAHMDAVASYNCKLCGSKAKFTVKEGLLIHVEEVHLGTPDGPPPAKCGFCYKSLQTMGHSLKAHIEAGHMDAVASYNCKLCKGIFQVKEGLLTHVEDVHLGPLNGNGMSNNVSSQSTRENGAELSKQREGSDSEAARKNQASNGHDKEEAAGQIPKILGLGARKNSRVSVAIKKTKDLPSIGGKQQMDGDAAPDEPSEDWRNIIQEDGKEASSHGAKPHKCTTCGKCFPAPSDLRRHVNVVHLGMKDHICDTCGKAFHKASNLRIHVDAVHRGIKEHECGTCKRFFSRKDVLKKHSSICLAAAKREKDNKHKCGICRKGFSRKRYVKAHTNLVHLGISKHQCHVCGTALHSKLKLKDHVNSVHLGVKAYKCDDCGKGFGRKDNLKCHAERPHDHGCDRCPLKFVRKDDVVKHVREAHVDIKMEL